MLSCFVSLVPQRHRDTEKTQKRLQMENCESKIAKGRKRASASSLLQFAILHGLVEQLHDFPRRELVDGVHEPFLTERIDGDDGKRGEDDVPNHELVAV